MTLSWLVVAAASVPACGPDEGAVSASGRCAEITDLLVRDLDAPTAAAGPIVPPWPVPANTDGDDRAELWFLGSATGRPGVGMVGYSPPGPGAGPGLYEPAWTVTLAGLPLRFNLDFSGDGYADPLMAERDDEGNTVGLLYQETQPDGSIADVAIPIPTMPGEGDPQFRDIDRDGVLDRVVSLDGEFAWISGFDGTVHPLGLPATHDRAMRPLPGDARLWGFDAADGGQSLIRITDEGHEVLWQGASGSVARGSRLHGDHIDLVQLQSDDGEPPWDAVLVRIDPSGRPIDERLLGEDIHGLARHDYDGDGERDLILSLSDGYRVQFGDADDEYTEPEPVPSIVEDDQGIGQSFDLDRDGRTERILLFVDEDGQRARWQALGWGPCP